MASDSSGVSPFKAGSKGGIFSFGYAAHHYCVQYVQINSKVRSTRALFRKYVNYLSFD